MSGRITVTVTLDLPAEALPKVAALLAGLGATCQPDGGQLADSEAQEPAQNIPENIPAAASGEVEKINTAAEPVTTPTTAAPQPFEQQAESEQASEKDEAKPVDGYVPMKERVLIALRGLPQTASNRDIAKAVGCETNSVSAYLTFLTQDGRIKREGDRQNRRIIVLDHEGPRPRQRPAYNPPKARGRPAENKPQRRFADHPELDPENVKLLGADHPAVIEKRTLFPSTVVDPKDSPRLLVSGHNSRKTGDRATKGPWAGMPIYTLTLEERATCPESCHHWRSCYGSGMPLARRHRHGPDLEECLAGELAEKQRQHPAGFVVRLHILGDFYSVDYVTSWAEWLRKFPALRCFGYTAWPADTAIGIAIKTLRERHWNRFAIRTSGFESQPAGATTIWRKPEAAIVPEGLVCPAEWNPAGKDICCGSCGLCWAPAAKDKTIAFIAHGPQWRGRPPAGVGAAPREERAADLPAERKCLKCGQVFFSDHAGNRICQACKPKLAQTAGIVERTGGSA